MTNKPLSAKSIVGYANLAFCLSFIGLPIYIYLPNYYHDNFGIPLTSLSLILLLARLVDTVQDPIIGIISDRLMRYKKIIIAGCCPLLGISFLCLFHPPFYQSLTPTQLLVVLLICLVICYSLFSITHINYQSYSVAISDNFHEKTRIIAWREGFFIVGIMTAAITPALLFNHLEQTKTFVIIGIAYCLLISLLALLFYLLAPNLKVTYKLPASSLRQDIGDFMVILQHRSINRYLLIFAISALSSAIPAALIVFFVERVLQQGSLLGLFLLLYFLGLLFGVSLWTQLSKRFGEKINLWLLSILLSTLVFAGCLLLSAGDVLGYALICVLSGMAFAGDLSLGTSIFTDIIQKQRLQPQQTVLFASTNFLTKLSLTLASSALIYMIGISEQKPYQTTLIHWSYAFLPLLFRTIAFIVLYHYRNLLQTKPSYDD